LKRDNKIKDVVDTLAIPGTASIVKVPETAKDILTLISTNSRSYLCSGESKKSRIRPLYEVVPSKRPINRPSADVVPKEIEGSWEGPILICSVAIKTGVGGPAIIDWNKNTGTTIVVGDNARE
jgi:hypothetical protein